MRDLEAAKAEVVNLRGAAGAAARLMAEMQVGCVCTLSRGACKTNARIAIGKLQCDWHRHAGGLQVLQNFVGELIVHEAAGAAARLMAEMQVGYVWSLEIMQSFGSEPIVCRAAGTATCLMAEMQVGCVCPVKVHARVMMIT